MQRITTSTWDPFTALARMDREFDNLVRRSWPAAGGRAGFVPAVEIVRDGNDVVVTLELPGVDVTSDVSIEVDRGKLVISGERRDPRGGEDSGDRVLVSELRYGSFRREFALPGGVSAEQVEATYDQGLLAVRVAGVVTPEPVPVKVPITTGAAQPAKVLEGTAE